MTDLIQQLILLLLLLIHFQRYSLLREVVNIVAVD